MILTGRENKFFYKGGRTYVKNPKFSHTPEPYQPLTPEDKSVIIIGNSPTILDYKLGHYIDSNFDIVVRLNDFETKGYEAFTGVRTDIWFTGASRMATPRNEQDHEYEIVIGLPFRRSRMLSTIDGCCIIDEALKKSIGFPLSDVKFIPHAAIIQLRKDTGLEEPSTGFTCIYNFTQFFSFKSVTLYGFDFFQKQWHYYDKDKIPVNKISPAHKWDIERTIVQGWKRDRKLNIIGNGRIAKEVIVENKELQTVYDEVFSGTEQFFTTDCEEERETIFRAMNWTGKRVLEIGCGTGDLAIRIFQAGAACMHGIDFSESAVISANEKADQFLAETNRHRFEVKNVDFDKIVESGQIVNFFDEDAYDVVVMQGVLEHFTSPPSSIRYIMKNLLRPDGVFLNSSPSFLNLRGIIWHTMLILFKAPMSLTDRFFLDVVSMEEILSFYGDVEIIPVYQDWGCGDLLIHDFKKRIKNVLRDMGDDDVNKVNAFMEWLERMVQHKDMLFKETNYTGAATLYKVYRMG